MNVLIRPPTGVVLNLVLEPDFGLKYLHLEAFSGGLYLKLHLLLFAHWDSREVSVVFEADMLFPKSFQFPDLRRREGPHPRLPGLGGLGGLLFLEFCQQHPKMSVTCHSLKGIEELTLYHGLPPHGVTIPDTPPELIKGEEVKEGSFDPLRSDPFLRGGLEFGLLHQAPQLLSGVFLHRVCKGRWGPMDLSET